MVNYVQLNQGMNRLGNIAAGVGDFMQRERELDLASRQQTMAEDAQAILNETRAYKLRMAKMAEHGKSFMATINEATQARKADGSRFNSLDEYLDSPQGGHAVDRIVQSLADTNSQYKKALGGRIPRAVRGEDGRYRVQVQEGENWVDTPMTFTGAELAQRGRLDAASAGLAELIYFKRDAERKAAAGELSPEQYQQTITEIQAQGEELLTRAEKSGIPRDVVIRTSRQGGTGYSEMVAEPSDAGVGAVGGKVTTGALGEIPETGLDAYMTPRREGQSSAAYVGETIGNVVRGTAGRSLGIVKDVWSGMATPIAEGAGGFLRGALDLDGDAGAGNPGEKRAQNVVPPAAQLWTSAGIPPSVVQEKAVTPTPQNTAEGPTRIRVAQAERALSRAASSVEDARDAAIQYANSSVIMGVQPDPRIMENLYAGDDMRGTNREMAVMQAQMDLDFAKSYRAAQRTGTQNLTNQLKIRDQLLQEQEQAAENAAERAVRPDAKNRSEAVKQLKGAIFSSYGVYRGQFANLGVDTSALPMSMATFPMVADLLAKYHSRDNADRAHNANLGWLGQVREPKTLMAYINKTIATADPEGTFATIRQSLAASPGNANLSPDELDNAAREIFRSFKDPDIDIEAQP